MEIGGEGRYAFDDPLDSRAIHGRIMMLAGHRRRIHSG